MVTTVTCVTVLFIVSLGQVTMLAPKRCPIDDILYFLWLYASIMYTFIIVLIDQ